MQMNVGCRLRYHMAAPTGFVFQVEAAKADGQMVVSERLMLPAGQPGETYRTYVDPVTATRKVQTVLGPGDVEIVYEATVDVDASGLDPMSVFEFDFAHLPMDTLEYLAPSRYCPSDIFTEFAHTTFGNLHRGHARVTAICAP